MDILDFLLIVTWEEWHTKNKVRYLQIIVSYFNKVFQQNNKKEINNTITQKVMHKTYDNNMAMVPASSS